MPEPGAGVEVKIEQVPLVQKQIIQEALKAGKFAITATEMLESMVKASRPTRAEASETIASPPAPLAQDVIFAARQQVLAMHMSTPVEQYIVQLVIASRDPGRYSEQLQGWIEYGGSPRATIALDRCARAHAWLRGQDFVSPDDVQAVAADVLRHRLLLSFEAEANGVTPDQVVQELLSLVPVG